MTVGSAPYCGARTFDDVVAERLSRRGVLKSALGISLASFLGGGHRAWAAQPPLLGFTGIPISRADTISLPPGHTWQVVNAWATPSSRVRLSSRTTLASPPPSRPCRPGCIMTACISSPCRGNSNNSTHGLLAVNFEYADDGLLHKDGMENWSAEKTEIQERARHRRYGNSARRRPLENRAQLAVRPSHYGRHAIPDERAGRWSCTVQTAFDPTGRSVLGTWNNCASGVTPWGTYLSCEENVTPYLIAKSGNIPRLLARYGVDARAGAIAGMSSIRASMPTFIRTNRTATAGYRDRSL